MTGSVGRGEQLERVAAVEAGRVERDAPGQLAEALGQPFGERWAAVAAGARQSPALYPVGSDDGAANGIMLAHPPRSARILSA